ncbi:MAG: HEAT repeat domain-containing protein [Isosphaeraceae bacterium]
MTQSRFDLGRLIPALVVSGLVFFANGLAAKGQEAGKPADGPPPFVEGVAPAQPVDPNPYRFAKDPRNLARWTPLDLWDAVDYLIRIDQVNDAVPFLRAFISRPISDATILTIRDRYGVNSILHLQDHGPTSALARPLLARLAEASRHVSANPERLQRLAEALAATTEEQTYAVERLREAHGAAVPPIVRVLGRPDLSPEARALIVANLGRLERSAVPPLLAALDAPNPTLVADAAEALGRLNDPRAVPFLIDPAVRSDSPEPVRKAARRALTRLNAQPGLQPKAAALALAREGRRYLEAQVPFPDGPFELWTWQGDAPAPQRATRSQAEQLFGRRFARQALALDPENNEARVVLAGFDLLDPAARGRLANADSAVLAAVLRAAIARGDDVLGAAAAEALGPLTTPRALTKAGVPNPLAEALTAPGRRVRFAAAKALVEIDPTQPFAGSSRVVPTLVSFLNARATPRVVVVDGNTGRAGTIAATLRSLGYDAEAVSSGKDGFRAAVRSADVEAIVIEPSALQGPWRMLDLVTNLRADVRTAKVPILLLQPDDLARVYARAEQLGVVSREVENNDTPALATPLAFTTRPRQARIHGGLPANDPNGDVFMVGPLKAGDAIIAVASVPSFSTLTSSDMTLTVVTADNAPLAKAQGTLAYTVPGDDVYYLSVSTPPKHRATNALYTLDVRLADLNPTPTGAAIRQGLETLAARFPRVDVLSASYESGLLRAQFARAMTRLEPNPLTPDERDAKAAQSLDLLARVAERPQSTFTHDLAEAATAVLMGINHTPTNASGVALLTGLPNMDAQRDLADGLLNAALPLDLRLKAANGLLRSIQRFGNLLTSGQERLLVSALNSTNDPDLKPGLAAIIKTLLPKPIQPGRPSIAPQSNAS